MSDDSSRLWYSMALSRAVHNDVSGALRLGLALKEKNAADLPPELDKLIGLCLHRLGNYSAAGRFFAGFPVLAEETESDRERALAAFSEVRRLTGEFRRGFFAKLKHRKALAVLEKLPHQSVRVLNIQGCLHAFLGKEGAAASCFSMALELDRYNKNTLHCVSLFRQSRQKG